MKTEDILAILSLVRNKTGEVKLIIEYVQEISERLSVIAKNIGEVASLFKNIIESVEDISKK